MWCPKCRTEYVAGITKCADCGLALVENLDEIEKEDKLPELSEEMQEKLIHFKEKEENKQTIGSGNKSTIYIDKKSKYEDMKSSAYTFLIIGTLGIIMLVLIHLGIISLNMASYMRIIFNIVMGGLFLIFIFIGFKSFKEMKSLAADASAEEETTSQISNWFFESYSAELIDSNISGKNELMKEQLYFKRYAIMEKILKENFPDLAENYMEDLLEKFYSRLYPDSL